MRLPLVDGNEHPDICGPCGGKCCTIWPGIPHPEDLGAPDVEVLRETVQALLATGRWVVDHDAHGWLEPDPAAWYLRPAMKGSEGKQPPWLSFEGAGTCTFFSEGRCEIYATRPRGCRALVPQVDTNCTAPLAKARQVDMWEPYEAMLVELRSEVED